MKSTFIAILLILGIGMTIDSKAQINKEVKILLKNGVKIQGALLESVDDRTIKVSMDDKSEPYLIRYDLISKIKFKGRGYLSEDLQEKIVVPPKLGLNTFYHELRGGLLFGDENVSGTINTINGYQFNQYLGTALGIGMNKYGNYITLPIYASIKGYILDQKVAPFYFGDVGYGFAWNTNSAEDAFVVENVKGGLYWQLGAGYQFNFYNSALVLSLGYINQHSSADYTYKYWAVDGVEVSEKRLLRRVNFSVGFLF